MRRLAVAVLIASAVAGCASIGAYEGERSLNRRQIAPGPGLFTGEAGQVTIMRRELPSPERKPADGDASSERTETP